MMSFSTTILLQEENVIQIPSSAVSLKINITDTSYIAKEIEFVIQIFTNYRFVYPYNLTNTHFLFIPVATGKTS